ncbi:DUF3040 domain-containing protein [Crystallibacter crystallopoietes]
MPLSEEERRSIEELEDQFANEDPELARELERGRDSSPC